MCLKILHVVIACDGCIILGSVLGTQNITVLMLSVIEGTYVVVTLIAENVWGSGDELTGALIEKVESWDWLCL